MTPDWYGQRYPSHQDLEQMAERIGVPVAVDGFPVAVFVPLSRGGPMIGLPEGKGPLEHAWNLAHELGHAILHAGPIPRARSKQEAQANRWAACALIPEARIQHHQNASLDAFIGALSAHYEEIPLEACETRKLAARIARFRLKVLEEAP